MFCKVCGTVNDEGTEVCKKCAHDLRNPIIPEQTLTQMSTRLGPENTMGKGLGGITRTTRILLYVTFAAVVIIVPVFFIASSMNSENAKLGIEQLTDGGTPIPLDGYEPDEESVQMGDTARIDNAKQIQEAVEDHASNFGSYPMSLTEVAETLNFDADPDIYDYYQLENEYQYELRTELEGLGVGLNSNDIVSENGVYYYIVSESP